MRASDSRGSPYTFKPGSTSSHSLLLAGLPVDGENRKVLDVGGGEGYLSDVLARRGYQVVCLAAPGTAVDPFPEGVTLIETDLDAAKPLLDGPFDFIICGDVLEHLRDPPAVLGWLRGLLAPGGRLLASLPNSGHLYFRLNVLIGRFPAHDRGLFDRTHLHFYTWDGWRRLFAEAGFEMETVRPTPVPAGLALGLLQDHVAARSLETIGYILGLVRKTLFAYQFVVTARAAGDAHGREPSQAEDRSRHAGV